MDHRLKKYFFSGLAVFVPFALAVYVFVWAMNFAESIFGKFLKPYLLEHYDFYFWGLGICILLFIVLLSGFLVTHYFGRVAHRMAERVVLNVPLLGSIYPAFKEISKFLFREQVTNLQKVVLVQWPRAGVYSLAFLTNKTSEKISLRVGRKLCNVMIPTVPNPLTGFVAMIPEEDIIHLALTVEEAIKIIVSGGVINTDEPPNPEFPDDHAPTRPAQL
jgi:uncharacterized membrane protein